LFERDENRSRLLRESVAVVGEDDLQGKAGGGTNAWYARSSIRAHARQVRSYRAQFDATGYAPDAMRAV